MSDRSTPKNSLPNRPPQAMIAAGGTGGHVFPGLAIAERLMEKGWTVRWIGTKDGMEAKLVGKRGIDFHAIPIVGLRGKGPIRFLFLPFFILRSFYCSLKLLWRYKPDLVVGMGGYVGFAPPMMATAINIPTAIHEQNAVAGLVNRVLSSIADLKFTAFPNTLAGAVCVGNPVTQSMLKQPTPAKRFENRTGSLRLLVVGGSRGAAWLNETLPKVLSLLPLEKRPEVYHQAGSGHDEQVKRAYEAQGVDAKVSDFIDDMSQAYADADLVICRAGAMTVAELATIGVASILVPFPYAVDDHQQANGAYLADQGGAYLFRQTEASPEKIAQLIENLTREDCLKIAIQAHHLAISGAAEKIAVACEEYVQRKTS